MLRFRTPTDDDHEELIARVSVATPSTDLFSGREASLEVSASESPALQLARKKSLLQPSVQQSEEVIETVTQFTPGSDAVDSDDTASDAEGSNACGIVLERSVISLAYN